MKLSIKSLRKVNRALDVAVVASLICLGMVGYVRIAILLGSLYVIWVFVEWAVTSDTFSRKIFELRHLNDPLIEEAKRQGGYFFSEQYFGLIKLHVLYTHSLSKAYVKTYLGHRTEIRTEIINRPDLDAV